MRFRQAILRVNGKTQTLLPNRANTFEEIYADFKETEAAEGRQFTIFLHPKENVSVQGLEIQFDLPLPADACFFANGYQSWSESRLLHVGDKIPALRTIARKHMGLYGDEGIRGIPRGRGQLHSWTYTYITGLSSKARGQHFLFLGSLNERTGFTLFLYDHASGILTVRKDLDDLKLQHSFPALDFWVAEGEEQSLFDAYFNACEVSKPSAPPALGWTSWYHHFTHISEPLLLQNLDSFAAQLSESDQLPQNPMPPVYFQVDDGWQTAVGDWLSVKPGFPNGMRNMAQKIKEKGMQPGLWLAPFVAATNSDLVRRHPEWLLKDGQGKPLKVGWNPMWGGWYHALDFYQDGVREYLSGVFHTVLDKWGFELVKLDFLFAVALAPPPGKTRGGVMWEAMEFLRHLTGSRRILACGAPLGSCFGLVDYCRIGGDVHTSWTHPLLSFLRHRERVDTLAALHSTLGRWQLNGRAFQNDPDVFILREENQKLLPEQQQTLLTINALLGNLLFTSDETSVYSDTQKAEFEEALSWFGSKIGRVYELEKEVWKIEFVQMKSNWSAYCNLTNRKKTIDLPNAVYLELRPFETMVLKT